MSEDLCPECGAGVIDAPSHAEIIYPDAADREVRRAHEESRCDPNCTVCEEETSADEAPGGQCAEGVCWHDCCIEERAGAGADGR